MSKDGGATFSYQGVPAGANLWEPTGEGVMVPIIATGDGAALVYATDYASSRMNMTVFVSRDDAASWAVAQQASA